MTDYIEITIKPHASTVGEKTHEWLDVYVSGERMPWAAVHIDFLAGFDRDTYRSVYYDGKSMRCKLHFVEFEQERTP